MPAAATGGRWYLLDERGEPKPCADAFLCSAWVLDNPHLWQLRYDRVGYVSVSTIFLALDQSGDKGPPLLFETKILRGLLGDRVRRCSTRAEAMKQHEAALRLVQRLDAIPISVQIICRIIHELTTLARFFVSAKARTLLRLLLPPRR